MEPIQWAFISLAVVLMILAFAVNPLQSAIDTAIENDARLNANFIVSAINLLQASPVGTSYVLDLPRTECAIDISEKSVRYIVINKNKDYSLDIIENYNNDFLTKRISIPRKQVLCKDDYIKIERKNDKIEITSGAK